MPSLTVGLLRLLVLLSPSNPTTLGRAKDDDDDDDDNDDKEETGIQLLLFFSGNDGVA